MKKNPPGAFDSIDDAIMIGLTAALLIAMALASAVWVLP